MLKTQFVLSTIVASLALVGCASVGPDYQRPQLEVPAKLEATGGKAANTDFVQWWSAFSDPVLLDLIQEAAKNNQDLLLATGRIEEARALAVGAKSNRYPSVDATLSGSKVRTSETAGKLAAGAEPVSKDFQLGLTASYEVDFWGKLSRADEAAKARLFAQEYNRTTVQTSLFSNLAQSYFALRAADAQLALAQATYQTRTENLRLQQKRFASGATGELDLHQAESEAAAAEVSVSQAKLAVSNLESAIAVLLGRSPAAVAQPVIARGNDIQALYQHLSLPADLPSDVLNRRPDILAAEQTLVAANADIGQAKAAYFPSLKLTTGIGYESRVFKDLIDPTSLLWNLGANLVQPVFRAGAIGAVVSGAEARKTQATAQYVQAVQGAFRDVHDALNSAESNEQIYRANLKRVKALKDSQRLAELRYKNGYSSYLEVLNAQRDLAAVETALIDTQRAHLSAVVSLYKAVGGGWEVKAISQ